MSFTYSTLVSQNTKSDLLDGFEGLRKVLTLTHYKIEFVIAKTWNRWKEASLSFPLLKTYYLHPMYTANAAKRRRRRKVAMMQHPHLYWDVSFFLVKRISESDDKMELGDLFERLLPVPPELTDI